MIPDIKRILYATDLSENSRYAFGYAIALAQRFGASITLFHVIENLSPSSTALIINHIGEQGLAEIQNRRTTEFLEATKSRMAHFCEEVADDSPECKLLVDKMEAGAGHPAEEILQMAETGQFDMVVMGTRGAGGLAEALMGSTARRVIRRSKIPVLTVRLPETDG